jgi:hypothetical protein
LILFATGCAAQFKQLRGGGNQTEWSQVVPASHDDPKCGEVLYGLDAYSSYNQRLDEAEDPALDKQVLLAVCPRHYKTNHTQHVIEQTEKIEQLDPEELHLAFDDRNPSHLETALLVFWSAYPYGHNGADKFNNKIDVQKPKPRIAKNAKFYAGLVDQAKLGEEMSAAGVSPEAQKAFVQNYEAAVARIDARLADWSDAERILYIDVANEVLEKRKQHFEANAAFYEEYDKLLVEADEARKSGADTAAVIPKLEDLRTRYLQECGKLSCQRDPVYAGASNELGMLYAAAGNKADAYVTTRPFVRPGDYVVTFAQAVHEARRERGGVFLGNLEKYRRAIEGGMDEETASTMASGPRFKFSTRDHLFEVDTEMPDYSKALEGRSSVSHFSAEVRSIKDAKDGLKKISFQKYTNTYRESYDCKKTNRIERINRDGRVIYEQNCKYREKSKTHESHEPVLARAEDVKHLKRGDKLSAYASGDEPVRVFKVYRDDKIVQLGAVPIEPTEPEEQQRAVRR